MFLRHTVLADALMANTIGGDSKNTVMKKFFWLPELMLLGKRKKKSWWTEESLSQIAWSLILIQTLTVAYFHSSPVRHAYLSRLTQVGFKQDLCMCLMVYRELKTPLWTLIILSKRVYFVFNLRPKMRRTYPKCRVQNAVQSLLYL